MDEGYAVLTRARVIRDSPEKTPPSDLAAGMFVEEFSLLKIDAGGPSLTVGLAVPGLVVLCCIRKQAEQATEKQDSKEHSLTPSASLPASRSCLGSLSEDRDQDTEAE